MVKKLLALALIGGGAYYLNRPGLSDVEVDALFQHALTIEA